MNLAKDKLTPGGGLVVALLLTVVLVVGVVRAAGSFDLNEVATTLNRALVAWLLVALAGVLHTILHEDPVGDFEIVDGVLAAVADLDVIESLLGLHFAEPAGFLFHGPAFFLTAAGKIVAQGFGFVHHPAQDEGLVIGAQAFDGNGGLFAIRQFQREIGPLHDDRLGLERLAFGVLEFAQFRAAQDR